MAKTFTVEEARSVFPNSASMVDYFKDLKTNHAQLWEQAKVTAKAQFTGEGEPPLCLCVAIALDQLTAPAAK